MAEQEVMTIKIREEGDEIKVGTEFHKKVSGEDFVIVLGHAIRGMLETAVKVCEGYGMTRQETIDAIFDGD